MISISDLERELDYIESIDKDDEQAYEKILNAFINIRFIPSFTFKVIRIQHDGKPRVTFRTRTHMDVNFFESINDLSYPPNEIVKSYLRCNRPNQSVFYSSENRPTSYLELVEYWAKEKNIGEKIEVSIGMWQFQRDLVLYLIPIPNASDRETDGEKFYGEIYDQIIADAVYDNHTKQIISRIFEFMYKQFKKPAKHDKKTYMITSAFSNLIMSKPYIDGILYPSVPYQGQGYNTAIKKSVVESGALKLVEVTKDSFNIEETEEGMHSFIHYDSFSTSQIDSHTGEIRWNHMSRFFKKLFQFKNPFV